MTDIKGSGGGSTVKALNSYNKRDYNAANRNGFTNKNI